MDGFSPIASPGQINLVLPDSPCQAVPASPSSSAIVDPGADDMVDISPDLAANVSPFAGRVDCSMTDAVVGDISPVLAANASPFAGRVDTGMDSLIGDDIGDFWAVVNSTAGRGTLESKQFAGLTWDAQIPPIPLTSKLEKISAILRALSLDLSFKPLPHKSSKDWRAVEIDDDPWAHLARARDTVHPMNRPWEADATASFAARGLADLGFDILRWREQMLDEIRFLKDEMSDEIQAWRSSLPDFVNKAY